MKESKPDGKEIAVFFLAQPFIVAYRGWGMSLIWNWFVAAMFALPLMTVPVAIGISCFVAFFKTIPSAKESKDSPIESLGKSFGGTTVLLLYGFIAHQFQ